MQEKLNRHIEKGLALFESRDYEDAYSELSQAIFLIEEEDGEMYLNSSQVSEIYLFRASALIASDDHVAYNDEAIFFQAMEDYEAALDLQPANPLLYNLRGKTYLKAKFTDYSKEAKADFLRAIELDKEEYSAMKSLGEILSKEGKYDEAIRYFSMILEESKDAETYMLRAVSNFKKPRPDFAAAARDFGEAQKILPRLEELYIWRAQCFQELRQYDSAVLEYDKLIQISPRNAGYYIDRGALLHKTNAEAALNDYTRALDIKAHPLAFNNRANLFAQQGNLEAALADAQSALKTDPNFSIAHASLAEIYALMRDKANMYNHLEIAVKQYFEDVFELLENPVYEPYRKEERFQQLIKK
ncbi:MAG: tetratricopeptide repeat protein [Bacteroidia bacterium]|nr:tetratricopeptide repeat protein [Bacteroidia bacterium]